MSSKSNFQMVRLDKMNPTQGTHFQSQAGKPLWSQAVSIAKWQSVHHFSLGHINSGLVQCLVPMSL